MELLIGSVISIIVEISKWLTKKCGAEMSKSIILLVVFLLALIAAWSRSQGYWGMAIQELLTIGAVAIAWYEIIYKRILSKVFGE